MDSFVFTRHSSDCKFKRDRFCNRCNCPKWVEGRFNHERFRKSASTRVWGEAEQFREKLEEALSRGLPLDGLHADSITAPAAPPSPLRASAAQPQPTATASVPISPEPAAGPPEVNAPSTSQSGAQSTGRQKARVTVQKAVDAYMTDARSRGLKSDTIKKLERIFEKQFLSWTRVQGLEYLDEVDLDALLVFRSTWTEGAIVRVKKQDRVIGFFWDCFRRNYVTQNPALSLSKIKTTQVPTDYFPRDEFDRIIAATEVYGDARGGFIPIKDTRTRLRTLTLLMRWSGLRIRDAVTLERHRLDGDSLLLYQAKTGQAVYVPLPAHVVDALVNIPDGPRPNPRYFFWSGNGAAKSVVADWQRAYRWSAGTGTLMGGYADDLFNIFYRMEPRAMVREGFAYGGQGRRDFQEQYGVLETVEKIEGSDNACSRATKRTVRVLRKPGASPLLFGKFLMNTTAFLALEDISDNLPRYDESVISVDMDEALQQAYERLEEDIRSAMKEHRGNKSLMSILLNTLLLYPDHPYDFGEIWARAFDPQTKEYVKFLVTVPENLTREALYAKERALIADVKEELRQGRRCQVYATYTGEKDVTERLETVLGQEGIRVAVLRSSVPTDKREDWYERQLKAGIEVVICHPKLVETGLDLLAFPTLYFYETGYSLHTLRQASRRSWRIGQRFPVRVKFVTYSGTMQETCLRLMGKKMLVALMMEGKFSGEGLQALDTDEDLMSAMARELVEKAGVGESADAVWRELDHEREKVLPRAAAGEPEPEEEPAPVLDLPIPAAAPSAPVTFGIHLLDPSPSTKKRKKAAVWPTATETNVQLSLFE